MKVKELIEKLQALPGDLEVFTFDHDLGRYVSLEDVWPLTEDVVLTETEFTGVIEPCTILGQDCPTHVYETVKTVIPASKGVLLS